MQMRVFWPHGTTLGAGLSLRRSGRISWYAAIRRPVRKTAEKSAIVTFRRRRSDRARNPRPCLSDLPDGTFRHFRV